jgi:tetratricopeptide (TPR) repeat protein
MKTYYTLLVLLVMAGNTSASLDYGVYWKFRSDEKPTAKPEIALIPSLNKTNVFYPSGGSLHVLEPDGGTVWQYRIPADIHSITVGDINQDDKPEVVIGSTTGQVYAYTYRGGLLWQVNESKTNVYATLGNLDERQGIEVLTASRFNVTLYSSNGSRIWTFNTIREMNTPPVLADVDLDGRLEVVLGANDLLYVIKELPYGYSFHSFIGGGVKSPVVADLDRDGVREIIYATGDGRLSVLNYTANHLLLEWDHDVEKAIVSGPVVLDLGGDGVLDVIVGSQNRFLYVVNASGDRLWRYSTPVRVDYTPAYGDFDLDGVDDLVFSSGDSLYILNNSNSMWSYSCDSEISSSPVVADITGDGVPEILVTLDDCCLTVFARRYYVLKSAADRFYGIAEDYYDSGSEFNAIAFNELSRRVYERLECEEGLSNTRNLDKRIEADELYNMGAVYYDFGYYINARELASKSLETYKNIGYPTGVDRALSLKQRAIMHSQAEELVNLSELDYIEERYIDSRFKALQASRLYRTLNYSEGVLNADSIVERAYNKIHADSYYHLAVFSYFNKTNTDEARHYLSKAADTYTLINDSEGIKHVEKIGKWITADELLQKAESSMKSGQPGEAVHYASTARRLYSELEYETGFLKASDLVKKARKIEQDVDLRLESGIADYWLTAVVVLIVVLAVCLIIKAFNRFKPS